MKRLIERLVFQLSAPHKPSQLFAESLHKYSAVIHSTAPAIDFLLNEKSPKAFVLYKKLGSNDSIRKLVYVMLCLTEKQSTLEEDLRLHIKKGALGFNVPYFRSSEIAGLKNRVGYHIYNVIYHVYLNSLLYKKLKMEEEAPRSLTHQYFLEKARLILKEYEKKVVESEYDFLKFYSNMYLIYQKLSEAAEINDILAERRYLQSSPLSRSNDNIPDQSLKNVDFSLLNGGKEILNTTFKELMKYGDIIYKVYNDCTRAYLSTGLFHDPYHEYFIRDNEVDYGLVPPFLSFSTAEKIAYIGKYICFLKSISSFSLSESINETIKFIDLSHKSSANKITDILDYINMRIKEEFVDKYKILELLGYINDTFMFGRVDFIEHLFASLKDSRKLSRNSVLYLLDNSLNDSFPDSPFNSMIDIYIKHESPEPNANGNTILTEGFSLYCKLEYPQTILLEQDFVLKLVYIFKFLWKLKKIEHLSRRIGNLKYSSLVYKIMHYVFYEVTVDFKCIEWAEHGLSLDVLRKSINKKLDVIMDRLFINTHAKKIEFLLFYMENAFISAGKGNSLNEDEIQKALREFVEYAGDRLENTFLFDIKAFVN